MRRLAVLALTIALLAAPAHAEDLPPPERVDLVAAVLVGLVPEGTARMPGNETAYVMQQAPGRFFGATEETRSEFTVLVAEPDDCAFEVNFRMSGAVFDIRFDASRIAAITVTGATEDAGYTVYNLSFDAPSDLFMVSQGNGAARAMPNQTEVGTSLSREQLENYANELVAQCSAS